MQKLTTIPLGSMCDIRTPSNRQWQDRPSFTCEEGDRVDIQKAQIFYFSTHLSQTLRCPLDVLFSPAQDYKIPLQYHDAYPIAQSFSSVLAITIFPLFPIPLRHPNILQHTILAAHKDVHNIPNPLHPLQARRPPPRPPKEPALHR